MPPTTLEQIATNIVRQAHRNGFVVARDIRTETQRVVDAARLQRLHRELITKMLQIERLIARPRKKNHRTGASATYATSGKPALSSVSRRRGPSSPGATNVPVVSLVA